MTNEEKTERIEAELAFLVRCWHKSGTEFNGGQDEKWKMMIQSCRTVTEIDGARLDTMPNLAKGWNRTTRK